METNFYEYKLNVTSKNISKDEIFNIEDACEICRNLIDKYDDNYYYLLFLIDNKVIGAARIDEYGLSSNVLHNIIYDNSEANNIVLCMPRRILRKIDKDNAIIQNVIETAEYVENISLLYSFILTEEDYLEITNKER